MKTRNGKKIRRAPKSSFSSQVKSQRSLATEQVEGRLIDPRSYSAYRERLSVANDIKKVNYTTYKSPVRMTKEEFLKSIS